MSKAFLDLNLKAKGSYRVSVVDSDGNTVQTLPDQDNLILDAGMDAVASRIWFSMFQYCAAGTGTTATRDNVSGTASQTGTTVTLVGSAYSFVIGDVGSWLKWASGEEARITAWTSATQVTVAQSQTVASGGLVGIYRCAQTGLTTELKRTGQNNAMTDTAIFPNYTDPVDNKWSQGFFPNLAAGTMTLRRTFDFTAEVGTVVYTEVGVGWSTGPGNLFSRVLLNVPVTVNATFKLRVQYNLTLTVPFTATRPTNSTLTAPGLLYSYDIAGITSTGANFTVTTTIPHHYVVGGKVNISGSSIPAYDAEWTIASVTTTTFTVTSALNPGTASATGTVFNNLKIGVSCIRWGFMSNTSRWDNPSGLWTTIPTGSGHPVTNGNPGTTGNTILNSAQGALAGSATANDGGIWDNAKMTGTNAAQERCGLMAIVLTPAGTITLENNAERSAMSGSNGPDSVSTASNSSTVVLPTTATLAAYTNYNWYTECVSYYTAGSLPAVISNIYLAGGGNVFTFGGSVSSPIRVKFEELQRKDNMRSLTFTVRRSWSRVLS